MHGIGVDDPLVWYEGSGTGDRRYLHADERGSIVQVTRQDGSVLATNSYDEWGVPATGNQGIFQYTGQLWLRELELYHYKARVYAPKLGRFLQTDPIGYEDGMNMYAYVGNDPVNNKDFLGTEAGCITLNTGCGHGRENPFSSGLVSYYVDLARRVRFITAQSGLLGVGEQNRTRLVEQWAFKAFEIRNSQLASDFVVKFVSNNKGFVAGRITSGGLASATLGPQMGAVLTSQAAMGGAFHALERVTSQMSDGGYDPASLGDAGAAAVATLGMAGATLNFNAETGDVMASYKVTETGSRVARTGRRTICNVNSEKGC